MITLQQIIESITAERLKMVMVYNRLGSDAKKEKHYKEFAKAETIFKQLEQQLGLLLKDTEASN